MKTGRSSRPTDLPQIEAEQLKKLSRTLDEGDRQVNEFSERIRLQREALERERLEREANRAPWWVPLVALLGVGGVIVFLAWRQWQKRRAVLKLAAFIEMSQEIAGLILEDADDEKILSAIRALAIAENDRRLFMQAFGLAFKTLPIPWYQVQSIAHWQATLEQELANQVSAR